MTRQSGNLPTKAMWIFCEGQTETRYLTELKIDKRLSRINVYPKQSGYTNANGIVQEACDTITTNHDFQEGDIIVCVFDKDENNDTQINEAKRLAEADKIQLIFSNPCFEFWTLCHYELHLSALANRRIVENKVKRYIPIYKKGMSKLYQITKEKLQTAKDHAKTVKENQEQYFGTDLIKANPITLMQELIRQIESFE